MLNMLSDTDVDEHYNTTVKLVNIERNDLQTNWGFYLTRSKFDPYPWICTIDDGTPAKSSDLKIGDCLLEINGDDVIGLRIQEIAELAKKTTQISLLLWNSGTDTQCNPEAICCGPMPINFQRLSACMSTILTFLECPICLDTIPPPTYQCDNGHLICIRCRTKSEKCPVCRLRLSRGRSLLSDQIYNSLIEAFDLKNETNNIRSQKMQQIFKLKNKKSNNVPEIIITQSHTNKFLAKVTGKSTSVDNLDNTKLINQTEFDGQLKIKSLSTNEIFQDINSPSVSRSSSTTKLSRNDKNKYLTLNANRSASCHGSFESLHRKNDLLLNKNDNDKYLYFCPFSIDCAMKIESNNIIEHFQTNHDGFLVQIFKSNIKIKLKKILKYKKLCYIIQYDGNTYFLKIELDENKLENVLLWTWFLGCRQLSKDYDMHVKLYDNDDIVFAARNCLYALDTNSYFDIKQAEKFLFLNIKTINQQFIDKVILDIDISKSDNE